MISTVTTTVVSIVGASTATGLLASLGTASVLTLTASLIVKELTTGEGPRLTLWGRNLDIIIPPLVFVFSFILIMRVWQIVS